MSNRRQSGLTLVELILAIVIVAVGLAGVLAVFQQVVRGSADPLVRKQMLSIAEGMMEEIALKPYAGSAVTPAGCARATFADVDDYDGYSSTGICDLEGNPVAQLAAYNVVVGVTGETLAGVAAKRITVSVSRGNDNLSLVGWRTDWACDSRGGAGECLDP